MMFYFGKTSRARLDTCHYDLIKIMEKAIETSPIDFSIVCGERGEEEQNRAFEEQTSKAKFGKSPHNFKAKDVGGVFAVDICPYVGGKLVWNNAILWEDLADHIFAVATDLLRDGEVVNKIEWGGEWSRFIDQPHFQIKGWRDMERELV